jgi:uncharacterized phage protein gp47/JayE
MALQIPTLKQAVNNTLHILQTAFKPNDDAQSAQTPLAAKLRRDNDYIQAFAIGAAVHGLYKYVRDTIAKQSCPLTATGIFLVWWGLVYGVTFKARTATQGPVKFLGTNGTPIPINTVVNRTADGWEYKTDAAAVIAAGEAVVMVTATKGGLAGNTPNGTVLSLPTPIVGVDSVVVTIDSTFTQGLERGTDDEEEEAFRSRLLFRIQNPPHGGAPSDYEMWAREVPGVDDAWCERTPAGPGSVGLRFMMVTGFPSPADQTAVYNYIMDDTRGPGADDLTVYLLTGNVVNVTITGLTPNDPATRKAVKLELQDLFLRFRRPAAEMPLSHINEAISVASGEYDHVLAAPVANPVAGANEILTLGVLTINGVVEP